MKITKVFKSGNSMAVRIPKEYKITGGYVYITRSGNSIILTPVENVWDPLFKSLEKFSDDFMAERNQPEVQKRKGL